MLLRRVGAVAERGARVCTRQSVALVAVLRGASRQEVNMKKVQQTAGSAASRGDRSGAR